MIGFDKFTFTFYSLCIRNKSEVDRLFAYNTKARHVLEWSPFHGDKLVLWAGFTKRSNVSLSYPIL